MELILSTQQRNIDGKKVRHLRKEGVLPLALFGKNTELQNLQTNLKEFETIFDEAGESTLLTLQIENSEEKSKVLISEVQHHPVTGQIIHATLRKVDLKEKIKANVPLEFVGEPEVVKSGVGILLTLIDEIEVECLPTDLPSEIVVNTESLKEVGDTITVADLNFDREKIVIDIDPEEPVAKIDHPQMEEEPEEEVSEEEAIAQVEATSEKKPEEGEEESENKE